MVVCFCLIVVDREQKENYDEDDETNLLSPLRCRWLSYRWGGPHGRQLPACQLHALVTHFSFRVDATFSQVFDLRFQQKRKPPEKTKNYIIPT